jgi:hypothetical protein
MCQSYPAGHDTTASGRDGAGAVPSIVPLMAYTVATEGQKRVYNDSLGNPGRDKGSLEPEGPAHLLESEGAADTLCGVSADGMERWPSIPVPGSYVGRYGCAGCKRVANYDELRNG